MWLYQGVLPAKAAAFLRLSSRTYWPKGQNLRVWPGLPTLHLGLNIFFRPCIHLHSKPRPWRCMLGERMARLGFCKRHNLVWPKDKGEGQCRELASYYQGVLYTMGWDRA